MKPTLIKQVTSLEIQMKWDDAHETVFSTEYLRRNCPCATCVHEQEENLKTGMFSLPLANQTQVRSMEPSGHNAVIIMWGDGHKTGIYTWDYLRQICPCEKCGNGVRRP